jgi:hypothetical protein
MNDGGLKRLQSRVDIHRQEMPADMIEALRNRTTAAADECRNAAFV